MSDRCNECGVLTGRPHFRDCPNRLCRMSDTRYGKPPTFRIRQPLRWSVHAWGSQDAIRTRKAIVVFGKWLIPYGPTTIHKDAA